MSDLLSYSVVYLEPTVTNKKAIADFCDYLSNKKTPADVFSAATVKSVSTRYAPCYLSNASFDFEWLAEITISSETTTTSSYNVGSERYLQNEAAAYSRGWLQWAYGDHGDTRTSTSSTTSKQLDRGSGTGEVSHIFPANGGALSAIDESFFPGVNNDNVCFVYEIPNNVESLEDCANNCSVNSKDVINADVLCDETINYIQNYISDVYSSYQFSIKDSNITSNKVETFAILCPVKQIVYEYNGKLYTSFVNGHFFGKTSILNKNKGIACGDMPIADNEDAPNGFFKKMAARKDGKNQKKSERAAAEKRWCEMFSRYDGSNP